MDKFSFEALRDFLREDPRGQIFDSLIAVEIGLEDYEVSWLAYQDWLEDELPDAMEDISAACVGYLVSMSMDLEIEDTNFDKLLETYNGQSSQ